MRDSRYQFICLAAIFCLCAAVSIGTAETGPAFSSLPSEAQTGLRQLAEPPPLAEREGPYSTPMYYLMHKGYAYKGDMDVGPSGRTYVKTGEPGPDHGSWALDRNRPDWQEAMIRDWAELGLNNTHLNIYPEDESFTLDEDYIRAIEDFVSLSKQYGMKVGVRLDAIGGYPQWPVHPRNPDNVLEAYLVYVERVASLLKGQTAYYVLGDELYLDEPSDKDLPQCVWTAEDYVGYFKRISDTIRGVDPDAKISMYGIESGKLADVFKLMDAGYSELADGVAMNHYSFYSAVSVYDQIKARAPEMDFYSNGVGYCSTATAQPRYPEGDPYSAAPTEQAHAASVAKQVFGWWDAGADTVPYYIILRNWVIRGQVYPRWFGFFGVQDFVIDEDDRLTVKRYPGWHAYQTITHTFYDRDDLQTPGFKIEADHDVFFMRPYIRSHPDGRELVLMLWHDSRGLDTTLRFHSQDFRYPVRVNLLDYKDWSDLPYTLHDGGIDVPLELGTKPTIIRLFGAID